MGVTNYPNGVASFGVPVLPGIPFTTGSYFFVHSGTGSNNNKGKSPTRPVASIDYAVSLCTADKGDVIIVMPGHTEEVTAAAGLDLDVAGIHVFGVGNGTLMPKVRLSTIATADVDVDAANITVEGIHFVAAVADITAAIDVNATNFTLRRCKFTEEEATENALIWVQDAAAAGSDFLTIEDCFCIDQDAANTHFVNFAGTPTGCVVRRNVLIGDWGTAAIGGAGVVVNCVVADNYISNAATDNDSCINFAATATGLCINNRVGSEAAQANQITAGDMVICENYAAVRTEDLQGILDPIAT